MTTPTRLPAVLVNAAQAALAREYEAVWGYPVLGPKLTTTGLIAAAHSAGDVHLQVAFQLSNLLAGLGITPATAQATYRLPAPITDQTAAARYALRLEDACAAAWRFVVVAASAGDDGSGLRKTSVDALVGCAVRATGWRMVTDPARPTVAFPGT